MYLRQGDIVRLIEQYADGYDYAMITFPVSEGDVFYIIDAIPCDIDGNPAKGYEVGVPMETSNFIKVVRHAEC